jgi:rhodanese-related sulfurtransferase
MNRTFHSALRPAAALALALALAGAAHAQGGAPQFPPAVGALVASAKQQVPGWDIASFRAALDGGRAGMVIDVREPDEYAAGHVPGAINVPRGLIEFQIWPRVGGAASPDYARQMTLYCGTGARCSLAAKSLRDLGFTDVRYVDMRFVDWVQAGHPTAR